MKKEFPETLQETIAFFSVEQNALEFMFALRWPDGIAKCTDCSSDQSYYLPSGKVWKCRACARKYSLKVGTLFEDSPISLCKWICAVWLISGVRQRRPCSRFSKSRKSLFQGRSKKRRRTQMVGSTASKEVFAQKKRCRGKQSSVRGRSTLKER